MKSYFFFQLNTQKVPRKLLLCTFWCQTPKEKQKLLFNPQQLKQADLSFYNGVLHEVHDTLKNTSATLKNYPDLFISSVLMMNIFVICINTLSLITSNLFKYADKVTDLSDYISNVCKYLSFNFYKLTILERLKSREGHKFSWLWLERRYPGLSNIHPPCVVLTFNTMAS